jgi:hypothetical protein
MKMIMGPASWNYIGTNFHSGLVMVDSEGNTVWGCPHIGNLVQMLPNGHIIAVNQAKNLQSTDIGHGGVGLEIRADCSPVTMGDFSFDNHEAEYDASHDVMLMLGKRGCADWDQFKTCESVEVWDLNTNTIPRYIDLGKFFDPSKDWGHLSKDTDWTHTNSISMGCDNNIIVSVRHLSAILSFDFDTFAKQWVLATEVDSDFTFNSEEDMFYSPHGTHQTEDCHIMMYDNANTRADSMEVQADRWSRGAEYELDFDTMTANLVWEFRTEYSAAKGSCTKMENGNYIVTCPKCDDKDHENTYMGFIYEVTPEKEIVAEFHRIETKDDSLYRVKEFDSLPTM